MNEQALAPFLSEHMLFNNVDFSNTLDGKGSKLSI